MLPRLSSKTSRRPRRFSVRVSPRELSLLFLLTNVTTVEHLNPLPSLTRGALSASSVSTAALTVRDWTGRMDTTNSVKSWLLKLLRKLRNKNDF